MVMGNVDDITRRELAELETVEVGGILATQEALALMEEAGTSPGELAARYCEDCTTGRRIELIGYVLDPDREPRGSGAVCVVLDPATHRITIYPDPY